MLKKLLSLSLLALATLQASATYVPVALTGFNTDAICNGAGAPNTSTTNLGSTAASPSGFDAQGYWLMDSTFNPGSGTTTVPAMPGNLLINSSATSGLTWQLKPYTGNNALRIVSTGTDSLVFQTPQTAGELYILYNNIAPSSTSGSVDITVNFTDGTTQLVAANPTPNWFSNIAVSGITSTVYMIGGRYNGNSGGGFQNTGTGSPAGPQLYQFKVTIAAANQTKTVRSVQFANTVSGHILNIFGITLNTPCSGTPIAGTTISSSGSTTCSGVNFTLSLTGSNAGVGTTYQWQTSATGTAGSWTSVSGATNATYTTSQTAATYYRAYSTCGGTGTADTSVPLNLGMTAVNQCYCIPVASNNTYYIANFATTGAAFNVANASTFGITSMGYSNYSATQTIGAVQGSTVSFSGSHGSSTSYTFGTKIYVDWNQNGVFTDVGETMFSTSTYGATFSGSFTVPAGAQTGTTRLRVISDYYTSTGPAPCAFSTSGPYGEAEDYAFVVIPNTPCAAPVAQPTVLVLTPAYSAINGSFTASSPAAANYLVVRTSGAALNTNPVNGTTYAPGATLGNGTVVGNFSTTTFSDLSLTPNTSYTYTIFANTATTFTCAGPAYNTTNPLTGTISTLNTTSTYTWNATSGTANWTTPGSWTPARNVPDPTDVLQFTNGGSSTATNIPTQTVRSMIMSGNTTVNLQAAATATLTLASDNNAATNELDIASGSSMVLNSTAAALSIVYSGTGGTGSIAGNLEISNTAAGIVNTINFANALDTVKTTGTLAAGGSVTTNAITSTAANLTINGTYNHKYTTVGGGNVPTATWGIASNVLISGYTSSTGGPSGGLTQTFNNFTYNCPNQTANSQWSGTIPTTINGTLTVTSTGTGQWQLATTTAYTINALNVAQTGGTVDFSTSTGSKTINVSGAFNQTGGLMKASGTGVVTLNFNGTTVAQNATFFDSSITGPIVYRISNPLGINLTGAGALTTTPVFKINNGGGVQVTSNNVVPVNATLTFTYAATGTTLTYDGTASQAVPVLLWPVTNGPLNFTINNSGTAPNNQITLPASRSIGGTLTLSNGVLVLGSNNLSVTNNATGAISISSPGAGKMIATDGSGQLIRAINTTAASTYLFPVGDLTGTADYSPVSITFATNAAARNFGVRVVNGHNPNDASATNYLNRYWVFSDDGGTAAYTYSGTFTYPTTDVVGTESSMRLSAWNGTAWTQVPSLASGGVMTIAGTQASSFVAFGGNQFTGRPAAANNIYTWNGSISTDYQVAGNWTPARNVPDPGDVLQFNNGIVDTVKNVPTQTITRLVFTNNTTGVFQAPSAATLTLFSDNNAATNELDIAAGSTLLSNGTAAALTFAYGGTGATGNVAGTLEMTGNTVVNIFNLANGVTTVAATGNMVSGGTSGTSSYTNGSVTTLLMNGTYNHKYTTNSGPAIPVASWNTGSTLLISGYTTATGGPNGGMNQSFYNVTYNCPGQTTNTNWSGNGPLIATNNLTMTSTGTGTLQFSSTQGYSYLINNYIQTGGTLNLNSGVATATPIFNVSGTFNQTGGTFTSTGNSTGSNAPVVNFNGTTVQNVNFFNAAPVGPITYRISNPNGINLTGTGTLTSAFNINTNGGVRISAVAATPINTTLALTYNTSGTTLTYDAPGSVTATAAEFPATNGPVNLTLNTGSTNNVVTMPFSRTIPGTFTMASGDLDITSNTLTLGTSASAAGTLTYTAGNIRVTTGSFVRWYGTSGLPTSTGTGVGYYPLAYGGVNRNVAIYFSTATGLSTGGTIGVGHNNVAGYTTGLSVADGAYTIDKRINSNWTFTQTGIVLNGAATFGMRLTGSGLFTSPTPANLRVMQANAVVGSHVAGSGVSAQRSGLVVSNLSVPYYIGGATVDMGGVYVAINTGNWSNGSTWDVGTPPTVANEAYINPGVNVTVDAATNTAKSLTIFANGTLTVNANTLTLDSAMVNNGTVNVGGGTLILNGGLPANANGITNNGLFNLSSGTVTLGPNGGGNKPFTNNSTNATLTVSGGALNINGNLNCLANTIFNQSGGNVNVDGNAGGVAANSVASGTAIVSLKTQLLNFTGGNITVVDPHIGSSSSYAFEYNNGTNVNIPATHTLTFGNGVSTDAGGSTNGAIIYPNASSGRISIGNLVINGPTGTNRWVRNIFALGINGNMTINNGGEFFMWDQTYLAGNLTVNTGGIMSSNTSYALRFAQYQNSTQTSVTTGAQTVSGAGLFRNAQTGVTANFSGITVQNSAGVTFANDASFSNTLTFTAGASGPSKLIMPGTTILSEIAGASQSGASQANGWVFGRYQKAAATGSMNNSYPVGDASYYTPVTIAGGTGAVTTAGAIWVNTTALDHPNIGTSTLSSTRSVNRYYTVQPVNSIAFATGALTATFNWNAADVDAGSNTALFKVGNYSSSTWTYPTIASPAATSIQATGLVPVLGGDFQIGEGCVTPVITVPPSSQTACVGNTVSFGVSLASYPGVSFQWQKGGVNIAGATNAIYTISSAAATDAGNYTVVLSSNCASVTPVTSAVAVLTVNTPPAITTQPQTQTICEGSPVTFTTVATGTGPLNYQWYKGATAISGATNASYTINVAAPGDAGSYSVTVNGASPCANAVSNTATLTVNPLPLTITAAGSTVFCAGGSVTLNASTTSGLTYQWNLGGSPVSGATNASYAATAAGNYTATITNTANGCSNVSNSIAVTNATPVSTITPSGTAAYCQGGTVTLTGPSTSGVTYQWNLNGNPISGATNQTYAAGTAGNYTLSVSTSPTCIGVSAATAVSANPLPTATATAAGPTTFCQGGTVLINGPVGTGVSYQWRNNGSAISGATSNSYTANASGNYKIVVTNTTTGCIDSSTTVAVTVNPLPTATITAASATTFCIGGSVVLNANTGTGLTYQWSAGGSPISGETNASYTATASGSYTVTVTNTSTTCIKTSTATTVTVNPLPNATATAGGATTFCQGGSVTISVPSASGQTYQWKNGGTSISGATNATYTATASGTYTCTVTNTSTTCNATSATAITVTVNPLPAATITPATTQTICQGDSVTYSAGTATGVTYQWKLAGNTITGATNATYVAYAPGAYTVSVTNTTTGCVATSPAATLVVNPRPTATISYTTPITFCDGGAVVLSGNSGTGYTYQWLQNGTPISGATNIDNIVSQSGIYSVVVTNSFGCASAVSQPVTVTVNPLPSPVITRNNSVLSTGSFVTYQWFLNNAPIPGGNSQSIVITQNGGYAVQVTDANGCTNRSPIMFVNNVGINTPGMTAGDVKIYPNPAHQVVYIDAPVSVNIAIRDLSGKVILVQDNVKEINLDGIADGVYMISVSDKYGRLIKTEKLFKSE